MMGVPETFRPVIHPKFLAISRHWQVYRFVCDEPRVMGHRSERQCLVVCLSTNQESEKGSAVRIFLSTV
jgi:hypothetical protein